MSTEVNSWSANQEKFQAWLALPNTERFPPTQEGLAEELELRPETLSRWKKLDGFMEAVTTKARQHLHDELADVYNALIREAKKGSYQHIKLVLEVAGEHTDQQEHSGEIVIRVKRDSSRYNPAGSASGTTEDSAGSEPV